MRRFQVNARRNFVPKPLLNPRTFRTWWVGGSSENERRHAHGTVMFLCVYFFHFPKRDYVLSYGNRTLIITLKCVRVVFNRVSKVIHIWFGFALLRSGVG